HRLHVVINVLQQLIEWSIPEVPKSSKQFWITTRGLVSDIIRLIHFCGASCYGKPYKITSLNQRKLQYIDMGKYLYMKAGIAAGIITVIVVTSCLHSQPTDSDEQSTEIDSTEIQIVEEQEGAYFLLKNSDDKLSLKKYEEDKIVSLGQYDININSIYTSDGQTLVAVLDTTLNSIRLYDI